MTEMDNKINEALIRHFVTKHKTPFGVPENQEDFEYMLDKFEKSHGTRTKWNNVLDDVAVMYGNNPNKYIDDYGVIRSNIIKAISENKHYKEFVKRAKDNDVWPYDYYRPKQVTARGIYNQECIGKHYLTLDLVAANFQAMKYANPEIFDGATDFDEYVSRFADVESITGNKQFRQEIFGRLDNTAITKVERFLIAEVWRYIDKYKLGNVVCVLPDEIIVELSTENCQFIQDQEIPMAEAIAYDILRECGIEVKVQIVTVHGYKLVADGKRVVTTFWSRQDLSTHGRKTKIKGLPQKFGPIVHSLLASQEPTEADRKFNSDECRCKFTSTFTLQKITKD